EVWLRAGWAVRCGSQARGRRTRADSVPGGGAPDGDVRVGVVAVARTPHRPHHRGVFAEAAAQAADVHVHGALVGDLTVGPDGADQLLAGQGLIGVGDEGGEQVEFLRRHVDELTVDADLATRDVDAQAL